MAGKGRLPRVHEWIWPDNATPAFSYQCRLLCEMRSGIAKLSVQIMNETEEITTSPAQLMRIAGDVAGVCGEIVRKTAIIIEGRQYIRVEGWQALATAHGCIAGSRPVEKVDTGYRAIGELRRISDGALLAIAEGFVGEDEIVWFGGINQKGKKYERRHEYSIRAMASTRAISRVCRSAFAHVVVLIDAELQTIPAEEMDSDAPAPKSEDVNRQLQEAAQRRRPR
jgi:hypothetical protein